jgi:hypothetical protein
MTDRTPHQRGHPTLTVHNIRSWGPAGARHQDWPTDWSSVITWLRLSPYQDSNSNPTAVEPVARLHNPGSMAHIQMPEYVNTVLFLTVCLLWVCLLFFIWLYSAELPDQRKKSITVPIYKQGDKSDCSNYRCISLLSPSYKMLSNILL